MYTLDTDACNKQIRCVHPQEQEDRSSGPVGYWSQTLNKKEQNLTTKRRECLFVVWAVTLLGPYMEGARSTIRTNYKPLHWIFTIAEANRKLARKRLRLPTFEFDIAHSAGIKQQTADGLSCCKTRGENKHLFDYDVPVFNIHQETFSYAPRTGIAVLEPIEEPKRPFSAFCPVVCMTADITSNEKVEISTLAKFITA